MTSKFRRGATAHTANGRSYVVEEVEDGVVYCSTPGGAETEFAEANLLTEAEWNARRDNKAGLIYARLRQARAYTVPPPKLDRLGAEQVLSKTERLMPGMLDYAAYTIAARILADSGDAALASGLSIVKCREVFDAATPELRASLVASLLDTPPEALIGAGRLGDNLMRAMLAKGMAGQEADFEAFGDRKRE